MSSNKPEESVGVKSPKSSIVKLSKDNTLGVRVLPWLLRRLMCGPNRIGDKVRFMMIEKTSAVIFVSRQPPWHIESFPLLTPQDTC